MTENVKKFLEIFQKFFLNKKIINLILRFVIFFIIIVFLLYFFEKLVLKNKKKSLDNIINMSIFNDGSSGTMAFKELLESLNYNVEKLMEPLIGFKISSINNDKNKKNINEPGIILIIEPDSFFQNKDNKTLEEIAKKGFIVIIFSESSYKIGSLLKPSLEDNSFSFDKELDVYKDVSSDLIKIVYDKNKMFSDVNQLLFDGKKRINKFEKGWNIITKDKEGILVVEKKTGKGAIVIVSESNCISNLNIRKEDNAVFGSRLISYYSRKYNSFNIYFDEFHHGFHKKYTLLYFIAQNEYFSIVLQIIIFLMLLFYLINFKFGQYKISISNERKKIFYFTESVAELFSKRKFTINIFEKIISNFHSMLKLKPYYYKKEALEYFDSFVDKNRNKKGSVNLIKKIFLIIKKNEYK